jgi:serine phosphatase RsbU (regulator of sigma subunit)
MTPPDTTLRKPHALLVGKLPTVAGGDAAAELELRRISAARAPALIRQAAAEVVVLDGGLPAAEAGPVLSALDSLEEHRRPSLVLVTPSPPVTRLAKALRRPPDAVVASRVRQGDLRAGIQEALQARRLGAELAQRETDLRELRQKLEVLTGQMAEELRLASRVQRSLLPAAVDHPQLEVAREFIPFREIGGDYYDFLCLGSHRMAVAIGDVMGKGIAAALLAASLKAAVRAQLQPPPGTETEPEGVVARVNKIFCEVAPRGLFASLFFAAYDLDTRTLEYVNAGHDYPFVVRRDGRVDDLVTGGTLLGLVEGSAYERGRVALEPDDLIVFYSDGVTDRGDARGEPFGADRLKEAAVRSRGDGARIVLYSMLGEVQGWSSGTPAQDDATLVVLKVR